MYVQVYVLRNRYFYVASKSRRVGYAFPNILWNLQESKSFVVTFWFEKVV